MDSASPGLQSGCMEDLKQKIAESFRSARLSKGLTQEAVAELCSVTPETVSNTERGESLVSLPVFIAMAAALDLNMAEIVGAPPARVEAPSPTRRRLDSEILKLVQQLSDAELGVLIGLGKVLVAKRSTP